VLCVRACVDGCVGGGVFCNALETKYTCRFISVHPFLINRCLCGFPTRKFKIVHLPEGVVILKVQAIPPPCKSNYLPAFYRSAIFGDCSFTFLCKGVKSGDIPPQNVSCRRVPLSSLVGLEPHELHLQVAYTSSFLTCNPYPNLNFQFDSQTPIDSFWSNGSENDCCGDFEPSTLLQTNS